MNNDRLALIETFSFYKFLGSGMCGRKNDAKIAIGTPLHNFFIMYCKRNCKVDYLYLRIQIDLLVSVSRSAMQSDKQIWAYTCQNIVCCALYIHLRAR